jgi:hypothetical protein
MRAFASTCCATPGCGRTADNHARKDANKGATSFRRVLVGRLLVAAVVQGATRGQLQVHPGNVAADCEPCPLRRHELAEHRWDEFRNSRMNLHRPRKRRIGRARIHCCGNAMDRFVSTGAEYCGAENSAVVIQHQRGVALLPHAWRHYSRSDSSSRPTNEPLFAR